MIVEMIETVDSSLLKLGRIDLSAAVEQSLFLAIRQDKIRPAPLRPSPNFRPVARIAYAASQSIGRRSRQARGRIVVLLLNPAHREIMRSFESRLACQGGPPVYIADGNARHRSGAVSDDALPLAGFLDARWVPRLISHHGWALVRTAEIVRRVEKGIGRRASDLARAVLLAELPRTAQDAACLASLAEARPELIVSFDEIGRRARLVGPIGRMFGVLSLDLAHAEAADPMAIAGVAYDHYAVFGAQSARVLMAAGVSAAAITEVGAPRFDQLVDRPPRAIDQPLRIVFASQWLGGQMTEEVKRATLRMAIRAAEAVRPCKFIIKPHPIENDLVAQRLLDEELVRPGLDIRIDRETSLHELLDGAFALLTGWSNSVLEAIISGVPAMCLTLPHVGAVTTFADEGIAAAASSAEAAGAILQSWREPSNRNAMIASGHKASEWHVGALDGRAGERTARLLCDLVRSRHPS